MFAKFYKSAVIILGIGVIIISIYIWQQGGFQISLKHGEDSAQSFGTAFYLLVLGVALFFYGVSL